MSRYLYITASLVLILAWSCRECQAQNMSTTDTSDTMFNATDFSNGTFDDLMNDTWSAADNSTWRPSVAATTVSMDDEVDDLDSYEKEPNIYAHNACASRPCRSGGTCINHAGGLLFACTCAGGLTGRNCEFTLMSMDTEAASVPLRCSVLLTAITATVSVLNGRR